MRSELPPPPIDAAADIRNFPFMPLDVNRLLNSDFFNSATPEILAAALTLWCRAWHQQPPGSLPSDDKILAHLSRTGRRWGKIKTQALHGFKLCSDGRLYHSLIVEKAQEAWASKQVRAKAARTRWEARAKDTTAMHVHSTSNAVAMQQRGKQIQTQTGKEKTTAPPTPLPPDLSAEVWQDFTQHRKAKRAPLTNTVINRIAEQLELARAAGWSPDAALTEVMNAGWTGLNAEWLENRKGSKSSVPGQHTPKTRSDQRADFLAACMSPVQPGRLIEGVSDDNG